MTNPNRPKLIPIFFYGLYMDEKFTERLGVKSFNRRIAFVKGYRLRLGKNATLLKDSGAYAYGILCDLSQESIDMLYRLRGLSQYEKNTFLVTELKSNRSIKAQCYLLKSPPKINEENIDYLIKLKKVFKTNGIPVLPENR